MEKLLEQISRKFEIPTIESGKPFEFTIPKVSKSSEKLVQAPTTMETGKTYCIKVKKYMTTPATPTFDFQEKWNKGIPMPLMLMTGEVIKQTRGMYYMKLHGEMTRTTTCMKCGRTLTHPVSQLYGLGPECGEHNHINPFHTEEELMEHLEEVRSKILNIVWTGWVIKSAIKEWKEVK